jgi:hypothetical protein
MKLPSQQYSERHEEPFALVTNGYNKAKAWQIISVYKFTARYKTLQGLPRFDQMIQLQFGDP